MATSYAQETTWRLPEHAPRLDRATLAPELARVIATITTINAWKRFGVSTRMVPGHYTPGT
jgi:hypothetical protein